MLSMRVAVSFIVVILAILNTSPLGAQIPSSYSIDPHVFNWIKSNISSQTKLPYSFYIPQQDKLRVYQNMNDGGDVNGVIERTITQEGLDIYDGAVYQMVLSIMGGEDNLDQASVPIRHYWKGSLGDFFTIRSGYPINRFIYDAKHPENVSSDNNHLGQRGFIFRIINADGRYLLTDPMNGQKTLVGFPETERLHWLDWKPVAGENAWVVMAAMQLYHKKHFSFTKVHDLESIELRLAEELARAAMLLQSEIGGIRMAPLGTYRNLMNEEKAYFSDEDWWYRHISTENNISWYSAFRMLYEVTGKEEYKKAMKNIERYLSFVWDKEHHVFLQGAYEINNKWSSSREYFALDVQTWAISCLGPGVIDAWLGAGTAYRMWQSAKKHSGVFDDQEQVIGVGYTDEHDRVSVEWSAGAMLALEEIGQYYINIQADWAKEAFQDKVAIRRHMETLRYKISNVQTAYSYSSRRGWIPFGWNSHDPQVMSLASSGWMIFVDAGVNPFRLILKRN
jgi:hypothetical protein